MPKCIFENFEIALVKRAQFKNFLKSWGWFTPKIVQTKHVVSGWAHKTKKDFVSLSFIFVLIYFKSGQLEIPQRAIKKNSIQLQNAVNGAMLIAMNRVIMLIFLYFMGVFMIFLWSLCWTKHLSLITLRNLRDLQNSCSKVKPSKMCLGKCSVFIKVACCRLY